jgi:hypothetical protein
MFLTRNYPTAIYSQTTLKSTGSNLPVSSQQRMFQNTRALSICAAFIGSHPREQDAAVFQSTVTSDNGYGKHRESGEEGGAK